MNVVSLPELVLTVDGQRLGDAALTALVSARVSQQFSLPTLCELVFAAPPGPLGDAERLTPGTELRLSLADGGPPLFTGRVTAQAYTHAPDGGRQIRIHGYDQMQALRQRGSARAHLQLTPAELAQELVGDLGLMVDAVEPGPVHDYLIQGQANDFDFLCDLLDRAGLYFALREETLHLLTLAGLPDAVSLTLGETLLEAQAQLNTGDAAARVTAQGWNPLLMETFRSSRSQPRSGRDVPATADPTATGGSGSLWLFDEELATPDQMESLAQAALDHRTAEAITLSGVAWGDPRLRPGTRVNVSGVAEAVAGQYVLTGVAHIVEPERGYLTRFETAPPPVPARARGTVATLGVVTQVDDPEGFGRVRVSLPAYDDVETDWMQVTSPGAGVNKGLVALPDPGDHVLVLCVRENPAQGLVVGGIYGPFAPYDPGVEGGQARRYSLRTPGGHLIRLDDERNVLRLEHRDGSYVEMTPETMRIHAEADLELTAPGRRIVIRGEKIDFERG
jgi:uncharacterized protein involved in type VI secretion and phage assembly